MQGFPFDHDDRTKRDGAEVDALERLRESIPALMSEAAARDRDAISAMGVSIFDVEAIYPTGGQSVEIRRPFEQYKPLTSAGSVAFFAWQLGDNEFLSNEGVIVGYQFAIRLGFTNTWLRATVDMSGILGLPDADDDDDALDPDPVDPALLARFGLAVAKAPGFGQLKNKAQREDFAGAVLSDVEGLAPWIPAAAAQQAEAIYDLGILPTKVKALAAEGKSALQISKDLGISKAKAERALVAEVPDHIAKEMTGAGL